VSETPATHKRVPWNKGKLTGPKPSLRPKHVWAIRTKLQIEGRARDLAMFNLAIDSKLRGCDVVSIRIEDVAASGYTADRATVRQRKGEFDAVVVEMPGVRNSSASGSPSKQRERIGKPGSDSE
jgi:hypothetical protein